jgi:hypothetical protein
LLIAYSYDIAQHCGDGEGEAGEFARADFFRTNPFDNPPGRYAISNSQLPLEKIAAATSWDADISKTLSKLDSNCPEDLEDAEDHLAKFHPRYPPSKIIPSAVLKMQREACESLALDLRLASHVVVPSEMDWNIPISKASQDPLTQSLEAQTKALTLRPTEPDDVRFTAMQPRRKALDDDDDDGSSTKELIPLVGKLLLSEWPLGEDPKTYIYCDPYGNDEGEEDTISGGTQTQTQRSMKQSQKSAGAFSVFQSSQPPAIIAKSSAMPPVIQSTQQIVASTQPPRAGPSFLPATQVPARLPTFTQTQQYETQMSSQEPMVMSTQQLPGKFGGRPQPKKPKKRLPGF